MKFIVYNFVLLIFIFKQIVYSTEQNSQHSHQTSNTFKSFEGLLALNPSDYEVSSPLSPLEQQVNSVSSPSSIGQVAHENTSPAKEAWKERKYTVQKIKRFMMKQYDHEKYQNFLERERIRKMKYRQTSTATNDNRTSFQKNKRRHIARKRVGMGIATKQDKELLERIRKQDQASRQRRKEEKRKSVQVH